MPDAALPIPVLHLSRSPRAVAAVAPQGPAAPRLAAEGAAGLPLTLEQEGRT
jgi:hypothetical protein